MSKTIVGVFSNHEDAEEAIFRLAEQGYNPKDISLVMRDLHDTEDGNTPVRLRNGAVSGFTAGSILGALVGVLVSAGVFPGLGALFIAGPLLNSLGLGTLAVSTLSGALTGGLAGGLVGVLTSLGMSKEEARFYEGRIQDGGILVVVPTRVDDEDSVAFIMDEDGAEDISVIDSSTRVKARRIYLNTGSEYQSVYYSSVRKKTTSKH